MKLEDKETSPSSLCKNYKLHFSFSMIFIKFTENFHRYYPLNLKLCHEIGEEKYCYFYKEKKSCPNYQRQNQNLVLLTTTPIHFRIHLHTFYWCLFIQMLVASSVSSNFLPNPKRINMIKGKTNTRVFYYKYSKNNYLFSKRKGTIKIEIQNQPVFKEASYSQAFFIYSNLYKMFTLSKSPS